METSNQDVWYVLSLSSAFFGHSICEVVAPALEAFGYQRIIFGSSSSVSSQEESSAGDWYELARESFAELGLEQEGVDAIFYENAKGIYGPLK